MARLARLQLSRRSVVSAAGVAGLLLVTLLGCSRPAPAEKERRASSAPAPPASEPTRLVVFAASSLTDVFNDLERSFEAANAGVDVVLSLGGSQLLKLQISEGAPGDVFASADGAHMRALVSAGLARPSQTFAHNELVIVVPSDNPARIAELEELPRAQRLVIGAASVPVGSYTRELFARASSAYGASFEEAVLSRVVSEESNVRLVRAKVELGEADAAVVYRTDAAASTNVKQVLLPPELNVRASYPIAVLTRAAQPELARRWVSHVLSPAGKAALETRGFLVDSSLAANGSDPRGAP
jgi:molybdate transport system substrate-binding protein